jgi:hypothetical protein
MKVSRCVSAGSKFELSHHEVRRLLLVADENPHLTTGGAFHVDLLLGDCF